MSKTIRFSSFLFLFLPLFAFSQQKISGIVVDSVSGEPLAGANVVLAGTTIGAGTDENGWFVINGPDHGSYILRFSYVGYEVKEMSVVFPWEDSVWVQVALAPEHIETPLIVVTGTRTLRSIADVPVRVEAIPEEEVEEKLLMTPSNVAMLLNESTGMRVQTTSAATSTANLRIQGLSGRYTQILHDGIPSLGGLSAGLSLTQIVPLDLRQVEVLKGATSSLYGADAIAGVVNFLPKVPGETSETSLLVNGTTQKGFDAAGFYSGRFDETGVSILASHNRQTRFDVDGDGFADVAQFERTTVVPRVAFHVANNLSLRLNLGIMDENRIGGAMASGSPLAYTEKIKTARLDLSSHIDWQPSPEQSLSVKLAWFRSSRQSTVGFFPFNGRQDMFFADAQFSFDLPNHNFLFGSAFRIDDFRDNTDVPLPRSYRFSVPSVFVQDEIHVPGDVTVLVGGRLDLHDTFGTFFVPRLSLMYRPTSSVTLRLGGGTGYKAPTIFVEDAEEAGFRNVRPLMNVKPEKAQSASFDVNWRNIVGSFTLDCNSALFFTLVDDALLADEDSLEADVVHLRNATGATTSIGGELSARLTYGDFKLSMGYTYVYAMQEDKGTRSEIDLNPRHTFGIVMIWENHEQELKVGLENYWTGTQRVDRNPFRTATPAYWVTGLIAEKGFGSFRVFVNFENIFDTRQTRYEPIWTGSLAGGIIRTLPVYAPLEGRVINGGIRYVLKGSDSQ